MTLRSLSLSPMLEVLESDLRMVSYNALGDVLVRMPDQQVSTVEDNLISDKISASSSSGDVQHERKSKRKQDQVVLKSDSEHEDETSSEEEEEEEQGSESESENPSNKQLEEKNTMGTKHNESKVVVLSSSEDETSSAEQMTMNDHHTKKTISSTNVQKALWRRVKDSMQLSISVNESQLYDKARRLKSCYLKRLRSNNFSMNDQEKKVYELSDKIWGKDEKAKLKAEPKDNEQKPTLLEQPHAKKAKMHNVKRVEKGNEKKPVQENKEKKRTLEMKKVKNKIELYTEYKRKYDIFMTQVANMKDNDFPVDLAMELVRASKKLDLEKRWKHVRYLLIEICKRRTRLIHETLEEVPSPSHSN
ncbi:hypothetical protein L6452_34433 [Arctium lappa]|uniref:Uncharacterized protein n=1 Tax=Arctium lappa TaxID=4217 RepID=A0ACB8YJB7_ARCLA|nr:hypothetical protein L6452_34433 [Arctium lappa]